MKKNDEKSVDTTAAEIPNSMNDDYPLNDCYNSLDYLEDEEYDTNFNDLDAFNDPENAEVDENSSFEPIQVICEINGFLVPAIIDTGAQISVMSSSCAQRCRISQLMDSRYGGKAIGMGSTDILGRIDSLNLRVGPVKFDMKLSVLRQSRVDFILGLDFLRRFRCSISMDSNDEILTMHVRDKLLKIPLLCKSQREGLTPFEDLNSLTSSGDWADVAATNTLDDELMNSGMMMTEHDDEQENNRVSMEGI